jgi:RNA polymerase sigma factor (sigma-70 family)
MARSTVSALLRATVADEPRVSDRDLLRRFAGEGDHAAFAAVVARHTGLVFGICLRVLHSAADAEDATQAVFLVLARKANAVGWQPSVANWLYTTARKVARNAKLAADRRAKREGAAAVPEAVPPADDVSGRELVAALDEELDRLPPRYREPLVLCYLEGLTRDEAAARLAVPVPTLNKQLERGRKKLAGALAARGCALGVLLLASATSSTGAPPPQLVQSILAAVEGTVPSGVAALSQTTGSLAMTLTKANLLLLAVGLVCAAAARPVPDGTPPAVPRLASAAPAVPVAAPIPPPDNRAATAALREAADILDRVETGPIERSRLWCNVADLRRRLGDREGSIAALLAARTAVEKLGDGQYAEWRSVGEGYGRLGDAQAVIDLVAAIPPHVVKDGYTRDTILQEAAFAAAEVGHARAAERIIDAISDQRMPEWVRPEVRRLVILHRAESGDVGGALKAAGELPTPQETVAALLGRDFLNLGYDYDAAHRPQDRGVIHVQLAAGNRGGARATLRAATAKVHDVAKEFRGAAAVAVVRAAIRLGDHPAARAVLAQVPADDKPADPRGLTHGWGLIARAYLAAGEAAAGRDDAATALAKEVEDPHHRVYVLQFAGLAQARSKRPDASKVTFARAAALVPAEHALHNLASAQALAGDFAGAVDVAKRLGENRPAWVWVNIAAAQAQAGGYDAARELVATRVGASGFMLGQAYRWIARLQAQAGRVTEAREWIGKVDDPLRRASALTGLAEGLYRDATKPPR